MSTKTLTMNDVKGMTLEQANAALTTKELTAVMKQAIATRIKSLTDAPTVSSPAEAVQEIIASEATTIEGDQSAPVVSSPVKVAKNKPNETTRTIEKFVDDTKGIRAGTKVSFLENNKPGAKLLTGTVQRLFDFYLKPERQEAKIKGDNGQRYYRFETGMTVITPEVITPEVTTPEVTEGAGI